LYPDWERYVATIIKARRKAAVLTPSDLPCLSVVPTINLTAGCLHGCLYCYARSYRQFPGEGKVVLYENTLDMLRDELTRRRTKPQAVYFSPSSDLFQPAPEVLELGEAIIRFLLGKGIGVALVTKGHIPDHVLGLLSDHAELVRAQIGIITLDEGIAQTFEPNAARLRRRLAQIEALVRAGVPTEARIDPILPTVTASPAATDRLFAALADIGVKRAAVDMLFLRPAIVQSLRRGVHDKQMLTRLLDAFPRPSPTGEGAGRAPSQKLPLEVRRETFALMRDAAAAHDIEVSICACENPDLARGTCNITGRWFKASPRSVQLPLLPEEDPAQYAQIGGADSK
jgi:DNA repair photolyase